MDKRFKVLLICVPLLLAALIGNLYKNKDSYWSALPEEGMISGDYYRVEKISDTGKSASLEAVVRDSQLIKVEYNEVGGRDSSRRYNQGLSKRFSEYNFNMMEHGDEGVSWAEVILDIEKQMIEKQSLTGEFDMIAGCTHSIELSMLPLAEKLERKMEDSSSLRYYELTKNLGGGLYGNLRIIVEGERIISCRYDELFAPKKNDIIYKDLKRFYRQSKYNSMEYGDPSGIGFNMQMDELNKRVVSTQNMLDIQGLPATTDNPERGKKRNVAWDNYIVLAKILSKEMGR
ncbi:hypothetical protein PM10SUCC1_10420 [Propionigenium maris DSM 9537]|uniref:Uncharacterized protein n=1 Tax=Propionigenium maris DSM 9537 TaxID=1123000 RepID=A0A9W6GJS1_9FUSO|nr:FMN-binding protein [Propionigenium maris]GLI55528.1 hypothetical protein PM10SUCC1_10420 [Propionigenium maris DSM 9537]